MIEQFDEQGRPIKVKVGPVDFEIGWHDQPWRDVYGRNGHVNHANLQMAFSTTLKGPQLAVTFLHELCHAVYDNSALTQDNTFDDEHAAEMYSGGLVAFWRDNPQTFKWWYELIGDTPVAPSC